MYTAMQSFYISLPERLSWIQTKDVEKSEMGWAAYPSKFPLEEEDLHRRWRVHHPRSTHLNGWMKDGEWNERCILCHGKPNHNTQIVHKDAKLQYSVPGRTLSLSNSNRTRH
ncbi:hypothetical protein AVEN_24014-1 [Araneus ventricosus]|uniref:Uncharacterized protein n=1 Tax=Araneus ventricosus TaxID=182803 RepID=A0A4Y2CZW5_ARAVE|nr:hypothetical protein AVEN_24014-1 [Araneus ventricosus]